MANKRTSAPADDKKVEVTEPKRKATAGTSSTEPAPNTLVRHSKRATTVRQLVHDGVEPEEVAVAPTRRNDEDTQHQVKRMNGSRTKYKATMRGK